MTADDARGPATTADPSGSGVLDDLVDGLIARLQAGEQVDPEDYAGRLPAHADRLRRLWPTLAVLAELGRSATGAGPGGPSTVEERETPGVLGDYRIVREVGRGGMGVVYEAEQTSLGRRVALKVLPFAAALDPRRRARFQLEAHAAACLHHPHIVPIHTVGCERGAHFYAMHFVDGPSLAAVIRDRLREAAPAGSWSADEPGTGDDAVEDGPPPSPAAGRDRGRHREVARLGAQAAGALQHAHEQGILHRDIKPSNLLVDGRGHLWVTDFGLARLKDDPGLTMTGTLVGTLRYMSPEQALTRRAIVDHRTDIYSLGATLYELSTLRPVFSGSDRQEVLRQIAEEEPLAPRRADPAIPRDLETIVLKAMAKDPARRYATARELADDLDRFLADQPIRARRPSPLVHVAKWARRHRAAVMTAAIAIAAAGAFGGWMLWREHNLKVQADQQVREARERYHQMFLVDFVDRVDSFTMEAMGRVALADQKQALEFYRRAQGFYETVVLQTGSDPAMRAITAQAYSRVGFCRTMRGDPAAEESYRAAIDLLEPLTAAPSLDFRNRYNLAGARSGLAMSYRFHGDSRRAEAAYRRAVAEWRRLATAFPNVPGVSESFASDAATLAEILQALGRHDEAARVAAETTEAIAALVQRPPAGPDRGAQLAGALDTLGTRLSAIGLRREAVRAMERGLTLAPDDPKLNNNLAWLLVEDPGGPPHDPARAVPLAERSVRFRKDDAAAWNTLGVARYRLGDWEPAAEAIAKSMELNRENPGGDPNDWLFLAMIEHRRGRSRKAREWFDQPVAWIKANKRDDRALLREDDPPAADEAAG